MSRFRASALQCVTSLLSVVLTKLEKINNKLIRLNVIGPIKIKINWLLIFRIIVHFIESNANSIYSVVIIFRVLHMNYLSSVIINI